MFNVQSQESKDMCERLICLNEWATRTMNPRNIDVVTVLVDTAKMFTKMTEAEDTNSYSLAYMDSASNTCGIGGNAWIIDYETEKRCKLWVTTRRTLP